MMSFNDRIQQLSINNNELKMIIANKVPPCVLNIFVSSHNFNIFKSESIIFVEL